MGDRFGLFFLGLRLKNLGREEAGSMQVTDKVIGTLIKDYLAENGIKQSFLCEKTGFTATKLSEICGGNRGLSVIDYGKICIALNVSFDTFMYGITLEG